MGHMPLKVLSVVIRIMGSIEVGRSSRRSRVSTSIDMEAIVSSIYAGVQGSIKGFGSTYMYG